MGKLSRYMFNLVLGSILVWVLTVLLFTDQIVFNQPEETSESVNVTDVENGTYAGSSEGHNGPIEVEVVVENGEIIEVNVLSHEETEGLADPALEEVPAAIVENNVTDVDTVSGATVTSDAIINAVADALADAQ